MKQIFIRIQQILDARPYHISTFEILSWVHLETTLIIHYHDCDHIFIFKRTGEDLETLEEESFYSPNHTTEVRLANQKEFSDRTNKYDHLRKQES